MQGSFLPTGDAIRDIVRSVKFGPLLPVPPVHRQGVPAENQEEVLNEASIEAERETTTTPEEDGIAREAQNIEREYCGLVAGHSVIIDFNRAWGTSSPNSTTLDHTVFAKLLVETLDRGGHLHQSDLTKVAEVKELASKNRIICQVMREEWEFFDNYSPSATLKAAEDAVIQDMEFKGHFEFLRPQKKNTELSRVRKQRNHLIYILRRHPTFSAPFSRVVGAHILTQTLVGNNRSSITEHDRSYKIFSNAFDAMHILLKQYRTQISHHISRAFNCENAEICGKEEMALYFDYFTHYKEKLKQMQMEQNGDTLNNNRSNGVWPRTQ